MTHDALIKAEASRSFEATRRFNDLHFFHVPFDELNADGNTERTLGRLISSEGRVSVSGPSGSGKSSLLSAVLGPLADELPQEFVPLRIPVAVVGDEYVASPGAFARYIIAYVTRWASKDRFSRAEQLEFERGIAEVTRRSDRGATRQFHIGLPIWLAQAELARQVEQVGVEFEAMSTDADAVEYLRRLISVFEVSDLHPVFVFDDSDAWLRIPNLDRSTVADAFFGLNVPMLAKEVDATFVIAVHEDYRELASYQAARELLSGEIVIPRFIDPMDAIPRILRDRLLISDSGVSLQELMPEDAVEQLIKYYGEGHTLRDLLRVAQRALQHAVSDGVDLVSLPVVEQAIVEITR